MYGLAPRSVDLPDEIDSSRATTWHRLRDATIEPTSPHGARVGTVEQVVTLAPGSRLKIVAGL